MTLPPASAVSYVPEFTVQVRPRASLRARIAGYGLRKTLDFAAWRQRREALRAERRDHSPRVFRAFIQVNVNRGV